MNFFEVLKKRRKLIIVILMIIAIVFIAFSIWNFWNYEASIGVGADKGMPISEVNLSAVHQGEGNVTHLTEEDFKVYPKLSVLKEEKEKYFIYLKVDDGFIAHYGSFGLFEYNGKYYSYGPPILF